LSLKTYVAQQNNNNNLFCQRIEKKPHFFFNMQGFFKELAQLIIIGLDKGKQNCALFKLFFFTSAAVLTLTMAPLKLKSNWLWIKNS